MEERTRAILQAGGSRSRATSPAPGARGHNRVPSATRFPIQTSPTSATDRRSRHSLEVPGIESVAASKPAEPAATNGEKENINGTLHRPSAALDSSKNKKPVDAEAGEEGDDDAALMAAAMGMDGGFDPSGGAHGVTLSDKPMDD
jgi:hypothetical protein